MNKKVIGFIVCTLLITAAGFSVAGADKNRNSLNEKNIRSTLEHSRPLNGLFEWPMFRHDLNNTGYSPSLAPDDDTILWSKYIGDWVDSNPTIKDERLYIAGDNYWQQGGTDIWCLNPFTGDEIWKTDLPDEFVWGSPTVANDRVYVLGTYFNLYCLDANTGDIKWTFPKYGLCGPTVVDDKVYFGSSGVSPNEGGIYCLNATTGEKIWEFDNSTPYQMCSPAVVNGKVYIGNDDGIFYCLDANTGDEIWNYITGSTIKIKASPSVFNNNVYFASNQLYCLNAETGDEIWIEPGIMTSCSPAVAYGNVYIGNFDDKVYCFNADTGDFIWDSPSLVHIYNSVAVADDKIFIASGNPAKLVCLNEHTGEIHWEYAFGGTHSIYSSPAVAYGNVYVGDGENGYIYAFGMPNEPPETPTKPDGPSEGIIYTEYMFNSSTTDPEEDDIYYLFDWDDGNDSGWIGPYASGATVNASHMWTDGGDYEIRVKAHDGRRESNWSEALIITIENVPPDAPTITGETNGKVGVEYEYTFNATDPDGDNVYYWIEWFKDDPSAKWEGPYTSGVEITRNHTWYEKGTYMIRAKAKDVYGAESDWGTLKVTMPKNKIYINEQLNEQLNQQLILKILEQFTIYNYQFPVYNLQY